MQQCVLHFMPLFYLKHRHRESFLKMDAGAILYSAQFYSLAILVSEVFARCNRTFCYDLCPLIYIWFFW